MLTSKQHDTSIGQESGEVYLHAEETVKSLQAKLIEKDILLSLNTDIASIKDRKEVLQVIYPKLTQLFHTDDVFICLLDKAQQTLNPFLRVGSLRRQRNPDFESMIHSNFPVQDGFIDTILGAGKPLVFDLEEVNKRPCPPLYIAVTLEAGLVESISMALYNGFDQIGILTLWSETKKTFTSHHIELIQSIADQISIVVTNILAYEDIRAREKENEILLAVSHAIASIRDKQDLLHVIQAKLTEHFRFSDICISLYNLEKQTYKPLLYECPTMEHRSDFEFFATGEYPIHDGLHNVIIDSETTVVFSIEKMLETEQRPHIVFLKQAGIKELACIRLQHNNEIIGGLVLMSAEDNSFKLADQHLIQRVSHHLASVLANIIASEEIKKKEHEKSLLLSFSNRLSSVRNKSDLSEVIHTRLKELVYFDDFIICLVDEEVKKHYAFLHVFNGDRKSHSGYEQIITDTYPVADGFFDLVLSSEFPLIFDIEAIVKEGSAPGYITYDYHNGIRQIIGVVLSNGAKPIGAFFLLQKQQISVDSSDLRLIAGISYQLSIALANILANAKIRQQLDEISKYKEQLEEEKLYLQKEVSSGYTYSDIIGSGPEMQKVFHLLSQVSFAQSTVLILGETGTGKELIARAIHNSSPRKDKLMVKVNCAAMPANLMESELFGHEKGSFTGAFDRRIGKFELANQGTLFLDEIGELPLDLQGKLLRAIQEKEIERVGGKATIKVNVRIIAATNRNLQKEVYEGRFRRDLFYRLNVFPITLPPLRNRKEDIPVLAAHFIEKYAKNTGKMVNNLSSKAMKELLAYSWPGNVRELEHLIERSVLMTNGRTIKELHLPTGNQEELKNVLGDDYIKTHEENERDHILMVLEKSNGKIYGSGGAAEKLGLPVSTLNSKIKKLGIEKGKTVFR